MIILNKDTFTQYASENYDNPNCVGPEEFFDDIKRINYVKRLFRRYEVTGELCVRLIMNHIIVLHNLFGITPCVAILFYRIPEYHSYLKPFLDYINILPDTLLLNGHLIIMDHIEDDPKIMEALRNL